MPRKLSLALVVGWFGLAGMLTQLPFPTTAARLTDSQSLIDNAFSTRPDWEAPVVSQSNVVNSLGNTGVLRQGDSYQVCGSVTDGGVPPSGIASVSVNMAVVGNVVSTGQTAAPLNLGSYTCGGMSYNYRTGALTADNPLSEGSKTFSIAASDNAGNSSGTSSNVTVDNTRPTAAGLQTLNKSGGTQGKTEVGDMIKFTYSEALHLPSIKTGWDGAATTVTVTINNDVPGYGNHDTVTFNVNLGTIDLGGSDYTPGSGSVFTGSMVWDSALKKVTITFTSVIVNNPETGASSTAKYYPNGAVLDLAGNAIDTAVQPTEAGKAHF